MRHDLKECGKRIQQFRKERGLTQETARSKTKCQSKYNRQDCS